MLKVKIDPVSGFGKTAEFAGVQVMHYDLATGRAVVILNTYEETPDLSLPGSTEYFLTQTFELSGEETSIWGTDDMVLVDLVLSKSGYVRSQNQNS